MLKFGTGVASLGILGYGVHKYFNSNKSSSTELSKISLKRSQELNKWGFHIVNLTPHTLSLFNKDNKHMTDILPEAKEYQLRLVNEKDEATNLPKVSILSNSYNVINRDLCNAEYYDDWLGGDYVRVFTNVREPTSYNKIEGVDNFPKHWNTRDIVTSTMVAEYIMKNRKKYANICRYVLTPDTDPRNVVRDETGKIKGVKGFVYYGNLSNRAIEEHEFHKREEKVKDK